MDTCVEAEIYAAVMRMQSNMMTLIWLVLLMLLPGMMIKMMQQSRTNSQKMTLVFEKVLMRVRKSKEWDLYWDDHRRTLRVVKDKLSWNDIMTAERTKEHEELGKVPGGMFAKWTTDRKHFLEEFFDAQFLFYHFIILFIVSN